METVVKRTPGQCWDGERARADILRALYYLGERDGRPPTIREIGAYLGRPSTGNISYHMSRLVREGKVKNMGGSRGYKVVYT